MLSVLSPVKADSIELPVLTLTPPGAKEPASFIMADIFACDFELPLNEPEAKEDTSLDTFTEYLSTRVSMKLST